MANPDLILIPFAQDGDKNTIPLELGIGDPVYRASLKAGFPPDTRIPKDIGGEAPDGLDFNGVLNILSQAIVFLQKGNAYQFDVSMAPYPIGALVRSNDNLTTYQSTVPNNSNNPNSNMTGWRVYNGKDFLVNDLTTGGTDKALTAEQGKLLLAMFGNGLGTNGHQKLPGGLIIQWMVGTSDSNGNLILANPVPFQVAPIGGMANEGSPTGWGINSVTVWAFDLPSSSKTQSVARVRDIRGTNGPAPSFGISGRILVWGY